MGGEYVSKRLLVCSVLLLALGFSCYALAETPTHIEELAKDYVLAVESGNYDKGIELAQGAAVSLVEYMKARGVSREGARKLPATGWSRSCLKMRREATGSGMCELQSQMSQDLQSLMTVGAAEVGPQTVLCRG